MNVELSIGLDAGGTQTRWAAVNAQGSLCAEGEVAPISGLLLAAPGRRALLQQPHTTAAQLAHTLLRNR